MSWRVHRKAEIVAFLSIILSALLYWQSNYIHFRTSFCACHRCLTENKDDDSWFFERFQAQVHPLMSRNSSVLSEKASKWWKELQPSYGQPDYRQIVEKLFKIIPDQEYYRDRGPDRCRLCSVVGNSGNLKKSHYGPLIDVSDFVLSSYRRVQSTIKANKSLVMVVNPSFMQYVHEVWLNNNGHQPSTGFLTVVLALHICDQVRVFGFGANKNGAWDHYFEEIPASFKTGGHKGSFEYDMIKELDKRNKIEMFRGW